MNEKSPNNFFWLKTLFPSPMKSGTTINYEQVANMSKVKEIVQRNTNIFGFQIRPSITDFDTYPIANATPFNFVIDGILPNHPLSLSSKLAPIKDGDVIVQRETMKILGYYKSHNFIKFPMPHPERRENIFMNRRGPIGLSR